MNACILIADGAPDTSLLLESPLQMVGFERISACHRAEALALAEERLPALAVISLDLDGGTGLELCRALKMHHALPAIGVVMLSEPGATAERIRALESGADDCVSKPFSPREVVLRIQAIVRRTRLPEPSPYSLRVGEIAIDLSGHHVRVGSHEIELTATEFRLLVELAQRCGQVLSRHALLASIWTRHHEVVPRTVDTHLRRLRDKLGPAARQLSTVRSFGYRLVE